MSCNGKDLTRKSLWGKCIRRCEKKHFFSFWFELIGMAFIWICFSLRRWLESRALPKWTNVLRFCFIYFFYSKHFMSSDVSKITNCLKKNWIRVVRPPERFYFAISHTRHRIHLSTFYMHFQQKNYISYHFGNGFKTHDYNSRNPNKNKGYERKMTGSTRILKGTRPYWIIVIMFLRDVSKYASIEFVLALQL